MSKKYIVLILGIALVAPGFASDLGKEQRWREQVADSIMDGEEVDVMVDGRGVFGIYTEAANDSKKGMIVVHGTGIHPNWEQVVQPIRVAMAEYGWNTLSIQMPILHNDANHEEYVLLYPEVPPRLKAAEQFLKQMGAKTLIIVAHSQGATMSSYYLSRNTNDIQGFVAIGMGATQKDNDVNSSISLKTINIPVLDLYGSDDLPGVLETVELRKQAAAHNVQYSQKVIEGANHFFDEMDDELVAAVAHWSQQF
jgi:pimeloyl-ACP methyl ester carboxylesterase